MRMNYADVGVIHAATQITAFPALLVLARQYQTTLWTCYSKRVKLVSLKFRPGTH